MSNYSDGGILQLNFTTKNRAMAAKLSLYFRTNFDQRKHSLKGRR